MINKYMLGRLGNQMFQYATIRAFQINNGLEKMPVNLDFSYIYKMASKSNDGWTDSLEYFNVVDYSKKKIKNNLFQKFLLLIYNITKFLVLLISKVYKKQNYSIMMYKIEKKFQKFYNKNGLYCFRLGYTDFKYFKRNNYQFYGTFESAKYFNSIKSTLQKEFTPKYDILEKNKQLYKSIEDSNSVCVSIRRGDFVTNPEYKKDFYVCTEEYFYDAIEEIKKRVKNPKFIVFSDDINWVKENMNFPKGTEYETGDDPIWEKLRLMYSCKHFILSNSTFSWWAQYLSRNKEKVVCAPKRWGNNNNIYKPNNEKLDIYENDWVIIEN